MLIDLIKEKLVPDTNRYSFWINGTIQEIVEEIVKPEMEDLFCELRGLLKEHAMFRDKWDTNQKLIDWLKGKNEY